MFKLAINKLLLLLLLSISCQSASASFDNHLSHQTPGEHISLEHQHQKAQTVIQSVDCQHCCHCHNAPTAYLPLVLIDFCLTTVEPSPAFQIDDHIAPFLGSLLRPPIS